MVEIPKTSSCACFRGCWWPERGVEALKTSGRARFGAGGGQRKVLKTPKMSTAARFWGWYTIRGGAGDVR